MFNEGWKNVHDGKHSGQPSLITDKFKRTDVSWLTVYISCFLKFQELYFMKLSQPYILVIKKCMSDGYFEYCLMIKKKNKWWELLDIYLLLWSRWRQTFGPNCYWWSHQTPRTNYKSIEWQHSNSSTEMRKTKQALSIQKVMATIFRLEKVSFWLICCHKDR